ncbi:hypothetical protein HOD29_00310 [archaeon]|mgnify:FL=1|jgi:hypothetical protein|nr:hypothetical protein [archaeon]
MDSYIKRRFNYFTTPLFKVFLKSAERKYDGRFIEELESMFLSEEKSKEDYLERIEYYRGFNKDVSRYEKLFSERLFKNGFDSSDSRTR